MTSSTVTVIGCGLAGSEAAWQLAEHGIHVRLIDMKPHERTPAQKSDGPAELVCSNSLRSNNPNNAVGLLKEEMRKLHSLIIQAAEACKVPAGDALAVDRVQFSEYIEAKLRNHPNIHWINERIDSIPDPMHGPVIIATGPLTADNLAEDLRRVTGSDSLYFHDALAPIVAGDSLDRSIIFAASRYGKGDGDDYLNVPIDQATYDAFVQGLIDADPLPEHGFENIPYFQGCMPLEAVAKQGPLSLRYGCMKPVGLDDPRTGRYPYAVLQLRKEDIGGQSYNLVGCQTKLRYGDQTRLFRMLPGFEKVEFLRLGTMHRNTYVNAPVVLGDRMQLHQAPHARLAGQITGVEGYVESAAHGLLTALFLASDLQDKPIMPPPLTCALGALYGHVRGSMKLSGRPHEPQNVHFGLFASIHERVPKKQMKEKRVEIARSDFDTWQMSALGKK